MNIKKAMKILQIEKTCVLRQDTAECNRDECGCQCCDLIQETEDVLAAYDVAIEALKRLNLIEFNAHALNELLKAGDSE